MSSFPEPGCDACAAPARSARSCARRSSTSRFRLSALRRARDSQANEELPALGRFSVDDLTREAEELLGLGLSAVILFGIPEEKDDEGSGAYAADGVVQRALRGLRARFPDLVLITDVCLCEYTSHGHCGVIENGEVANDATLELLGRTAVSHVEAGADVVAPSDMMDGRVGALRAALDEAGFAETRDRLVRRQVRLGLLRAVPRGGGIDAVLRGSSWVPDGSANVREALRECELDVEEGAAAPAAPGSGR